MRTSIRDGYSAVPLLARLRTIRMLPDTPGLHADRFATRTLVAMAWRVKRVSGLNTYGMAGLNLLRPVVTTPALGTQRRRKARSLAMDGYIICATPRTGSTLLCDLLDATGVAGKPDSFFMADVDPVWVRRWKLPTRDQAAGEREYAAAYLGAALEAGRSGTGIFGLRLMRKDLKRLTGLIDAAVPGLASDRERLQAAFGRLLYIHLHREDTLAQAVSMVKAEQTGLWHIAPDGTELERLAPPQEPEYDFDRIAAKLAELQAHESAWLAWFAGQGIEPIRIGYESLAADPAGVVACICTALGLPVPAPDSLKPGVARLADAVSRDWMRRFRLDGDSLTPPPPSPPDPSGNP